MRLFLFSPNIYKINNVLAPIPICNLRHRSATLRKWGSSSLQRRPALPVSDQHELPPVPPGLQTEIFLLQHIYGHGEALPDRQPHPGVLNNSAGLLTPGPHLQKHEIRGQNGPPCPSHHVSSI